jgi:hypothetical protein
MRTSTASTHNGSGCRRLTVIALSTAAIAVLVCVIVASAARRSSGGGDAVLVGSTPTAVLEHLRALRRSSSYGAMEPLIVPERRREVTMTLIAVDDFLHANEALRAYVREYVDAALAADVDRRALVANLEVFSEHVELLHEAIDGESAIVVFRVNHRLPLRRAALRRFNGAWQYDPGPGYATELPAALGRMARGLRELRDDLRAGRIAAEALRRNPQKLTDELRLRLRPGLEMLPPAAREAAEP